MGKMKLCIKKIVNMNTKKQNINWKKKRKKEKKHGVYNPRKENPIQTFTS